jgi:tocopherol O-methyltransferase
MPVFSRQQIVRYYDLSEVHYKMFWGLRRGHALHYGYWEKDTRNFLDALSNTNKKLAEIARIKNGDRVLDAGCGVGGSALWLASVLSCKVTGITVSPRQVRQATELSIRYKLGHLVDYAVADYCATAFPDASFDIVWALESLCHAADKKAFLVEAMRVLKPGGRVVLADYFQQPSLTGKDEEQMQQWASGWAIGNFVVQGELESAAAELGFHCISTEDASAAVMRSARRMYRAWLLGKPAAFLYKLFRPDVTRQSQQNVDTALLQYKTLRRGLWKYTILVAEKPV